LERFVASANGLRDNLAAIDKLNRRLGQTISLPVGHAALKDNLLRKRRKKNREQNEKESDQRNDEPTRESHRKPG